MRGYQAAQWAYDNADPFPLAGWDELHEEAKMAEWSKGKNSAEWIERMSAGCKDDLLALLADMILRPFRGEGIDPRIQEAGMAIEDEMREAAAAIFADEGGMWVNECLRKQRSDWEEAA